MLGVVLTLLFATPALTAQIAAPGSNPTANAADRMLADYFRNETALLAERCLADIKALDVWKAKPCGHPAPWPQPGAQVD